jgi:hypothetical protein
MMLSPIRWALCALLATAGALALLPPSPAHAGGNLLNRNAVGGIVVDASGVVKQATVQERAEILRRMQLDVPKPSPEMNLPVELRKVSLRGLEAALQKAVDENRAEELPEEVQFLAGLQRIQYILVYPELQDIVLAGPGEGWKVDQAGNVVGITTGRPVLQIDDLLMAFRTVHAARDEGISVSIDPTEEGLRNFQAFMQRQRTFNPAVVAGLADALGPQKITFTGIPTNTHFARVLLAADYRMKCMAMELDEKPSPILPSYLRMLKSAGRRPGNATPRWWMACDYDPLARSKDRLAWEIRGPGVKVLTEDEALAADGTTQGTGQADPLAKKWADMLTEKYEAVAQRDPALAELQTLMDMAVVAAVIEQEDLKGLANARFPLLTGPDSAVKADEWFAPQSIATQVSHLKVGRDYVITASGGVQLESWEVAKNQDVDPAVKEIHAQVEPATPVTSWWWN